MSTPPLVLGYSKPDISMPSDVSHGSGNTFPEARNSVHLTLFIHLEPVFTANSLNTVHLDCSELPVVVVCICFDIYIFKYTNLLLSI